MSGPIGLRRAADATQSVLIDTLLEQLHSIGWLDDGAAVRARVAQQDTGARIDTVLIELGLLSETHLVEALAAAQGLSIVTRADLPPQPLHEPLLAADYLKRVRMLPLREADGCVELATPDAFNADAAAAIAHQLGLPVRAVLMQPADFTAAFDQVYGASLGTAHSDVPGDHMTSGFSSGRDIQRLKDSASEAPIVRLVSRIITEAVRARASDIHIEAMRSRARIRFRVDGVLIEHEHLSLELHPPVISRVKILADLDIAERRLPQDGRITTAVDGRTIDVRAATTPVATGENVVLRILDRPDAELDLGKLGFDVRTQSFFDHVLANPNGLLLVTGPTGSGKSTTLYGALNGLNTVDRKIFSIENPVEIQCDGINQIPVRPELGLDFASALRTILRQDPDIVMIGEMRDQETARISVRAALTGHMVLSTLHTNSAAAAVTRLFDLELEPFLLAATLNGVVSQRLVRTLCEKCASPAPDMDDATTALAHHLAITVDVHNLHQPVGCDACSNTGFRGRTTIAETLIVTDDIKELITAGASEVEIERAAVAAGMTSLLHDGAQKVLHGVTVASEIMRAVRIH